MKILKGNILIFIILFAVIFSLAQIFVIEANFAQAENWLNQQTGFGTTGEIPKKFGGTTPTDVRIVTANVVRAFLGFLGTIFLVLLVVAGFKWMTAQGEEDKVNEAKDHIKRAIIGLLIILMAWSITEFITSCLVEAVAGSTNPWYCPSL
jgi:Ca2+/Na+ antiporter